MLMLDYANFLNYIYVWIYENAAKESTFYYLYFTLISILFKAACKPCKRAKKGKGRQWKEDERMEEEKKGWLSF